MSSFTSANHDPRLVDRALGALTGLALGDALGMPTQSWSRAEIARRYGVITTLLDADADQPIAPGMPAGSITDDTDQALLVARLLVEGGGHIDASAFARALADWERDMVAKGSQDLLGPSTKAAIAAIEAGVSPTESGRTGSTNGAAMRVAPVGVAVSLGSQRSRLGSLVDAVVEASQVTHNTSIGLAAAAAVAAAVSAGLEGADAEGALAAAVAASDLASDRGEWVAGGAIGPRIERACRVIRPLSEADSLNFVHDVIGTSLASQESVVAAFALAHRFDADPFAALCHAASLGGDTDTIAAIAGAMLGARHGMAAWPASEVERVVRVNGLDLAPLVDRLLALRGADADLAPVDDATRALAPEPDAQRGRVLHTGQAIVDLVMSVPAMPPLGGDVYARSSEFTAGGGFNVMAAASRFGGEVVYLGVRGTGPLGDIVGAALSGEGIATPNAPLPNGDSGFCVALVDDAAERSFVSYLGADGQAGLSHLRSCPVEKRDVVYVTGYSLLHQTNREALVRWMAELPVGVRVVFDPSPLIAEVSDDGFEAVVARASIWTTNLREGHLVLQRLGVEPVPSDAATVAEALAARLGCDVVVRAGALGAFVAEPAGGSAARHVPGFPAEVVDTNGAGDAHTGVLCAHLAEGGELVDGVRWANAAASIAVSRRGPATAPTRPEIEMLVGSPRG